MSIQSKNIFDLLSDDGEGVVLPKATTKETKVEQKAPQGKKNEKKVIKGQEKAIRAKMGDKTPRIPANPNKRIYDRRSGTGRGREMKKGGAGKGNWGTLEPKELTESAQATTTEETAPKEPTEVPEGQATEPEKVQEEEDKTLSYDEWKAKNETKVVELPAPVRQAGEGVDDSAWTGYVPLVRDDNENTETNKKSTEKKKKESSGTAKIRVDEVFKIQEKPVGGFRRGGGNRRGRDSNQRSFRGGRGGNRPAGKNFSLNEEAFPSLSTKA